MTGARVPLSIPLVRCRCERVVCQLWCVDIVCSAQAIVAGVRVQVVCCVFVRHWHVCLGARLEAELELKIVCWYYFGVAVEYGIGRISDGVGCGPLVVELFMTTSYAVFGFSVRVAVLETALIVEWIKAVV